MIEQNKYIYFFSKFFSFNIKKSEYSFYTFRFHLRIKYLD